MSFAQHSELEKLKADLRLKHGLKLIEPENIKTAKGIATGWNALDSFVTSGGFPCGELSLLESAEGLGALTLWLEAAARLTRHGQRVAWLNRADDERDSFQLHASTAAARGVDLQNLFLVKTPSRQRRGWVLQEMLASQLFSLVGCDLGEAYIPLRECRSLLMQARRSGAAVVLFHRRQKLTAKESPATRSLASLVLNFDKPIDSYQASNSVEVLRAAHRPVPHSIHRRNRHVDFTSNSKSDSEIGANIAGLLDPSLSLAHAGSCD